MVRLAKQTTLCQLNDSVDVFQTAVYFRKDSVENIFLFPAPATERMQVFDGRCHQLYCGGEVATHERHLTFQKIGTVSGPIASGLAFRKAPQPRHLLLRFGRISRPC